MKYVGIRRFDDLGRIVIPKEGREAAYKGSFEEGLPVEIYCEEDGTIILKPAYENRQQLLTRREIKIFNSYIENAGMGIEFGNTVWCDIYYKIVGDEASEYALMQMERYQPKHK